MLRRFMAAMMGTALFFTLTVSARAAEPAYSDLDGHWSQAEVEAAAQAGWVNGYPDGTFRPEVQVSRSEFVKLLLAAIRLTPDSDAAAYLHQASQAAYHSVFLRDMETNWLTQAGWTRVAVEFGLIQEGDFPDGQFGPSIPLTRGEAAVLVARALGLVNPAHENKESLSFADTETISPEFRGYVQEAVQAGVIRGLPDGTFGGSRPISRAEAVAMIGRAVAWMEEGVDPDIRAYVKEPNSEEAGQALSLSVPAQVIDGTVYLPARDVIRGNAQLYGDALEGQTWDPAAQELNVTLILPFRFRAGDMRYVGFGYEEINEYAFTFPTNARLLYGEVMIPVYGPETSSQTNLWPEVQWDETQKTVTICFYQRYSPMG